MPNHDSVRLPRSDKLRSVLLAGERERTVLLKGGGGVGQPLLEGGRSHSLPARRGH